MGRAAAALVGVLVLGACTERYILDLPDVNLDPPADLVQQQQAFRAGTDRWRGDPKAVADWAIRHYTDVPWKADPFRPGAYAVAESPEWGTYVTRGYRYPSAHVMRYRVKIRQAGEIWYPVQISRYKIQDMDPVEGHFHNH